jgi:hypothetical protein
MNISLFRMDAAGPRISFLPVVVFALAGSLLFSSCSPESSLVEGSFDGSTQPQGGPSKYVDANDLGWNVGLELGWGLSGAGYGKNSRDEDKDWLPSGYAPLANKKNFVTLDGTMEIIRKGSKFDNVATHLYYLNLLGDVTYHYSLGESGTLFGGGGPYIGYGIGGKTGTEASFGGADGYKRFDWGLHLKAGYQHPSTLQASFGYELGLYNQSPAPDFTSQNRTWSINIGYSLNKIIRAIGGK